MKLGKTTLYLLIFISVVILFSCSKKNSDKQPHIDDITFKSSVLDEDKHSKQFTIFIIVKNITIYLAPL